ncbi:hypothetical protein DRO54_04575 [Candidatus Bathyarchaeota archaeon]|nr:MAG: hypothetical protein DRO54_04575 [Candidatus Bathyarchaeota archaeon]
MPFSIGKVIDLFRRAVSLNSPHHVQWMLTRRCNYRCRGCTVWQEHDPEPELSTDKVKAGLDILRKLGVVEIVFSGGNPLLREDIDEIISYASKYFVTTVYDNGSIAVKKIDALRDADFVAISIDSINPEKNDYIRGVHGAFKTALTAIERLTEEGIIAGVSTTISQMNLNEIVDLTKYFTDRGIPVWYCLYSYDVPSGPQLFSIGKRNDEFEFRDRKAAAKLFEKLLWLKREKPGIFITERTLVALRELFLNNRRIWECKALRSFFMIDPHGRVAGCHLKEPVASIFELPELWESERFNELRKKYSQCRDCAYLCYIFYSLHSNLSGTTEILLDQLDNIKFVLSKIYNQRVRNQKLTYTC